MNILALIGLLIALGSLTSLHRKVDQLIMKAADIDALLVKLNDTTNTLAADVTTVKDAQDRANAEIQALKDQIAAGTPVTQAQLDSIGSGLIASTDKLTTIADALSAIGASSTNPVPDLPA